MDIKELLEGYFKLTDEEKDDVLSKLAEIYSFQGIELGMSPVQRHQGSNKPNFNKKKLNYVRYNKRW